MATVREQNLTLFEGLAKLAGAHSALSNPIARLTVLAPTDEVIRMRCCHPTALQHTAAAAACRLSCWCTMTLQQHA
jgi:hypothetical protein